MKVFVWEKVYQDAIRAVEVNRRAKVATAEIVFLARRKELTVRKDSRALDEMESLNEASRQLAKMSDAAAVPSSIPPPVAPRPPLNYSKSNGRGAPRP